MNEEDDVLVVTAGERATLKGETCADQMTDSFQAHKDVMQFLSRARAMRSALVAVFVRVLCTLPVDFSEILFQETKITTISQMM